MTLADFFHIAEAMWNESFGSVTRTQKDDDRTEIRFVTGGWSYNEEIIAEMQAHIAWFVSWESSHRGGLHVIEYGPTEAEFKDGVIRP